VGTAFTTEVHIGDVITYDNTGLTATVTAIGGDGDLTVSTPLDDGSNPDSTFSFTVLGTPAFINIGGGGSFGGNSGLKIDGNLILKADHGLLNISVGEGAGVNTTGGGNSAVGYHSLFSNTTGSSNSAVGVQALYSNTSGSSNDVLGAAALYHNTTGGGNSVLGGSALYNNIGGSNNDVLGDSALYSNITGNNNVALGNSAGFNLTAGDNNIAIGANTNFAASTGSNQLNIGNTIFGDLSLHSISIGNTTLTNATTTSLFVKQALTASSAAFGATATSSFGAAGALTLASALTVPNGGTGWANINPGSIVFGNGASALATSTNLFWDNTNNRLGIGTASPTATLDVNGFINTSGTTGGYQIDGNTILQASSTISSTLVGQGAGTHLTTDTDGNVAVGSIALRDTTTGSENTAIGSQALTFNITGGNNSALGIGALVVSTGNSNIGIGSFAGFNLTSGDNNIAIGSGNNGNGVNFANPTGSNQLNIGNLIYGTGLDGSGDTISTGNVGIGTTTPGSILSVQGVANWTTATSTYYSTGGLNLAAGCFAIAGNCLGLANISGTLSVAGGGTGTTTWQTGSIPFFNGTNLTENNPNLFWDNTNSRLGIGTASPSAVLHILDQNNAGWRFEEYSNGDGTNYRNYRARGTIAAPTAVLSGDRLASFLGAGYNGSSFNSPDGGISIWAAENYTNTSTGGTFVTFGTSATGTNPGGGGVERMRLDSTGNIGIGTTSPWRTLSVTGTVGFDGITSVSTNQSAYLCLSSNKEVVQDSTTCLASSARFKQNIETLSASSSLSEVMALTPVSFQYTPSYNGALQSDPNFSGTFVGFIAEDVAKIDPRLITVDATGPTPTAPHGVRYENITAILVGAIQGISVISGTFKDNLIAWLGDASNGINDFFAKNIYGTNVYASEIDSTKICATDSGGKTCITRAQLDALLNGQAATGQGSGSSGAPAPSVSTMPGSTSDTASSTPDQSATTTAATAPDTSPQASTTPS
jgi:hypothetical protein